MLFVCADNGRDLLKHHVRYDNQAAAERKPDNPGDRKVNKLAPTRKTSGTSKTHCETKL
jgi:hypothetical protein